MILRVAAVQFQHQPGDKQANLAVVQRFARDCAAHGVQLACFPEMCLSGYWHLRHLEREALAALAEEVPGGPSSRLLASLAAETAMGVGAGLLEVDPAGELYNTYVVALPDGRVVHHRKLHAFVSPHITSGDRITVFDSPWGARLGILICYDNNIVENVRLAALAGVQVLLAPHQTGGCASGDPHTMGVVDRRLWDARDDDPEAIEAELRGPKGREWLLRWLPSRAHDNGLFLVFSNGVGPDDDEVRTGNSMVLDPYGRILAETWKAGDDVVEADLDLSLVENSTGRRWLRTRRPELYCDLAIRSGREEDTRSVRFDGKGA